MQNFKYIEFLKDEIVLVAKSLHPLTKMGEITLEELIRNELSIIDITGADFKRRFNLILNDGDTNPLTQLFIQFALKYNF